jgi:hypothetical protein
MIVVNHQYDRASEIWIAKMARGDQEMSGKRFVDHGRVCTGLVIDRLTYPPSRPASSRHYHHINRGTQVVKVAWCVGLVSRIVARRIAKMWRIQRKAALKATCPVARALYRGRKLGYLFLLRIKFAAERDCKGDSYEWRDSGDFIDRTLHAAFSG